MAPRTRNVKASLLDDRIDTLNRNAIEDTPTQQVFRTVSIILALVRDKFIDDKDSAQLSDYCFNVCEVLKTTVPGKDVGEFARKAFEDLERIMCEIERILRRGASTPHNGYSKDKVGGHKLKIQEILDTLNAPSSPLDETRNVGESAANLAPVDPHRIVTTSVSESACGRLIKRAFAPHELPSLIETIFSSKDESDTIRCLIGDDAQIFVDVIDEALDMPDLSPRTRKKCLRSLYRTCGRHALLPRVLKIPVCYGGVALYRGGFADVWKGEHCGRDVAVKVIRTYSNSDLQKIIGKFCKEVVTWKSLWHENILPLIGVMMSDTQFAMISDWMVNGNINDFVKAHPDANRLELLGGVARGLIYVHSQGMIHGDLKGANILIDETGNARLADFGLLTIISDPTNLLSSSSYTQGGTARWMSPELIAPQRFGLKSSRPTKYSDCYALGMVIYETMSGNLPFHEHTDLAVFVKVLEGERPPQGVRFTKTLWNMLELCWAYQPSSRPSIEDVRRCLEVVSNSPESPPPVMEEMEDSDPTSGSFDFSIRTGGMAVIERSTPGSSYPLSPISTACGSSTVDSTDYEDLDVKAVFGPRGGRDGVEAGPSGTPGKDRSVDGPRNTGRGDGGGRRSAPLAEPLVPTASHVQQSQSPRQLRSGSKRSRRVTVPSSPADQHETPGGARDMYTNQPHTHLPLPSPYAKGTEWAMKISRSAQNLSKPTASMSVGQQANSTTGGGDEGKVEEERKYCFCNRGSQGSMIGCDDPDCEREWYHLRCLGLMTAPLGAWYCEPCKAKRNKAKGNKAKPTRGKKRKTGGRDNAKA